MKKTLIFIAILSITLAACTGSKKTPPIQTYSFAQTTSSSTKENNTKENNVVRMMPASIVPQFSNYAFIYRVSSVQYLTDPYRQFLTAPDTEITAYLNNRLAPSLNAALISNDNLAPANFILQGHITELYADYQNKSTPEAVMSIQFILYQCDNGVTKQVGTITLSEKTNIKPNDPASLLEGYQHDLDKIAGKLSTFINHTL